LILLYIGKSYFSKYTFQNEKYITRIKIEFLYKKFISKLWLINSNFIVKLYTKANCDKMKILFIGARLFEDVALYTKKRSILSIISESNSQSPNLKLADSNYIVSRGMDEPMNIAIKEEVDGVVPLIGIDKPLIEVAMMKEKLEKDYGIPVVASPVFAAKTCVNKFKSKEFFVNNNIKTPEYFKITKNDCENIQSKKQYNQPMVLKQTEGQGGSGIKIIPSINDAGECFKEFENGIAEKFIEGPEISIEVLRWNGKTVPLVPVYKGNTTLECIHPLKKIKKAPLEIKNINNKDNNRKIQKIAVNIAEKLGIEGTADIDIIFNNETQENNVIEINARPSGTRYVTNAATDINIMHELIDMASGDWNALKLKDKIKNYSAIEIPVGSYPSNKNNYKFREFSNKNSWIIHGPKNYERITIRGKTMAKAVKISEDLKILK
jgi:carbamoylphosphate synthase large subunit